MEARNHFSGLRNPLSDFEIYPRRESNPHLRFRKPPFHPLNYGDMSELRRQISDIRFQISIMPRRPNRMMRCNARPVLRPAFSFYQT
jgi:hypothetical protein